MKLKLIPKCLAMGLVSLFASSSGVLAQADEKIDNLQKQIDALQARLNQAKEEGGRPGFLGNENETLKFNFYGETKWNIKNGADKPDPHRFVLIPGYKLSDYAYFLAEIEIEHGGVQDNPGRFDGMLELEQFYADVKITDNISWRSLGVSLIPVGTVNLYHEPDQFYSVHRPVMYKYVVPSTWFETGTGFFGENLGGMEELSWMLYFSQGLTDDQGTFDTLGKWNPRGARPSLREDDGNDALAITGKLEYQKGNFSGSVSTYMTSLQRSNGTETDMQLFDIEASYRFTEGAFQNFELIADYAWWDIDDPSIFGDNNVGEKMDGYRLEVAYHHMMGNNELVPFIRAEGYDLSSDGNYAGFSEAGSYNFLSYGAMYKFGTNWEIKATMRQSLDDDSKSEFSFGIGFQF